MREQGAERCSRQDRETGSRRRAWQRRLRMENGGVLKGMAGGPQRSGVDPALSSSRACLHTAFIASSVPFVFMSLGQFQFHRSVLLPHLPG